MNVHFIMEGGVAGGGGTNFLFLETTGSFPLAPFTRYRRDVQIPASLSIVSKALGKNDRNSEFRDTEYRVVLIF